LHLALFNTFDKLGMEMLGVVMQLAFASPADLYQLAVRVIDDILYFPRIV